MTYYLATTLPVPLAEAEPRVEAALKDEGFGVLTRIDIAATLREKIGAEFHPYRILGACNPSLAYEALKLEDHVGTMLPCNVILQSRRERETEVAAVNPVASMQAIDNPKLLAAAEQVREKLARVIDSLG